MLGDRLALMQQQKFHMNRFGAYVRTKREQSGRTLTDFARQLEISPAYWSRIETGRENPPKDELIKRAATILDLGDDELFVEAGRLPPDMRGDVAKVVEMYRAINKPPSPAGRQIHIQRRSSP